MSIHTFCASSRGRRRGATLFEFAMSLMVLILVIFGLVEMCMAVYTTAVLADAAREGVRYAIVHGVGNTHCSGPNSVANCSNPDVSGDRVVAVVQDYTKMSLHTVDDANVTVAYETDNEAMSLVTVSISYQYVPWVNIPGLTPTLRASAQGRIVH